MLLPEDVNPRQSAYFGGGLLLQHLYEVRRASIYELFGLVKSEISFPVFVLSLDWLFLLDLVELDGDGWLALCS
ncbi:ABC-three component system middle component 6 [Luteibacter sp.]|uniref:ABC-three component system middle component 6 n=1 Tax=Luteibacter sp. TaxID=1886636 RepID=UPI003F7CD980